MKRGWSRAAIAVLTLLVLAAGLCAFDHDQDGEADGLMLHDLCLLALLVPAVTLLVVGLLPSELVQAKRQVWGETLIKDMAQRGIIVRAASKSGVAEEAGFAYKDLTAVVDTLHRLDISRRVVSLAPIGNIKG